jgi:hypothetical protein
MTVGNDSHFFMNLYFLKLTKNDKAKATVSVAYFSIIIDLQLVFVLLYLA